MDARPIRLDIFRTAIPMRSFEHAAARRDVAEAVVTRLELSDGRVGWGETLPREYVTGETIDSVIGALERTLWPAVVGADAFAGLMQADQAARAAGPCMNAALCALELPLTSASVAAFQGEAQCRRPIDARVSGVLGNADPAKTARRLRLMRLFGLRDFKLKLGFGDEIDAENLGLIHKRIGKAVAAGKCTLRVDVNGGWDAATTPERVDALRPFGVCVVEQPVYCHAGAFVELARRCPLPLMADESLLTAADAQVLSAAPRQVWWNIRISKNGGFANALFMATKAAENGVPFVIGCMVGESGILSAAQRRLLQAAPRPRFVEGNYGRFLLADDLTAPSPRFGYGGRLRPLARPGLGVAVSAAKLAHYGRLVKSLTAR